jgi:hypothetical protein
MVLRQSVGLKVDVKRVLDVRLKKDVGTAVKVRPAVSRPNDPFDILELTGPAKGKAIRNIQPRIKVSDRGSLKWNRQTARTKKESALLESSEQKLSMYRLHSCPS